MVKHVQRNKGAKSIIFINAQFRLKKTFVFVFVFFLFKNIFLSHNIIRVEGK